MNPAFLTVLEFSEALNHVSMTCLGAAAGMLDASAGWGGLLLALVALAAMEIVLGIDNIIFISIVTGRLPKEQQAKARFIGLALAMVFRVILLCFIATIVTWTQPIFRLDQILPFGLDSLVLKWTEINEVSVRDLILFGGGAFLIYQSVREMSQLTEAHDPHNAEPTRTKATFASTLVQIAILDIVFSLDSVITAVGMVDHLGVMIAAVLIAVAVMMLFSGPISKFVLKHPSVKVLALAFLLMIGVVLVAEGFGTHFNKNYIYFAWPSRSASS